MRISRRHLVLMFILVIGLDMRLYPLYHPFLDHHSWRQTETAMIAQNFYKSGFNILKPK